MGYKTKSITNITEPAVVSLGSNPNYIQFEGIANPNDFSADITLTVKETNVALEKATFTITETATQTPYVFTATRNRSEVNNTTFFLDDDKTITAENIRTMLMKNTFFSTNFQITIPFVTDENNFNNGIAIRIISNKASALVPFSIALASGTTFFELGGNYEHLLAANLSAEEKLQVRLKVLNVGYLSQSENDKYDSSNIAIKEKDTQIKHILEGTFLKSITGVVVQPGGDTWQRYQLDVASKATIAENIRDGLSQIPFFKQYFTVSVAAEASDTVVVEAKSTEIIHSFYFDFYDEKFLQITDNVAKIEQKQTARDYEIQLDVYRDTGIFLGEDDKTALGTYVTTLSKAYTAQPLWFDVNAIAQNIYKDEFIDAIGWCDPGTVADHRFVAKRFNGYNTDTFYISDVLYTVTGYTRNLERNDLSAYIYNTIENNRVKPLTRQPRLTHIKGQAHYFSFLLSDPYHSSRGAEINDKISLLYKLYTQSGNYLTTIKAYERDLSKMKVANTIRLNLDWATDQAERVGRVDVYLARKGVAVSEALQFDILPACLHKVNDFAFLNSLGGWDTFNFGGMEQTDFKTETTTINKMQTPGYKVKSQLESVYSKEVTEQFIAQTAPINAEVVDWLKELASSVAVYQLATKRYIIIDELNIKHNSRDDLFTLQMKYHYSDTYNALLK